MRFHMGVSFSWKTIKKFIIPFLLGLLAYLGFNGIFDNFNIPLGFIKANALENYDTTYTFNYTELDLFSNKIDDNISYLDFFDSVKNISSDYYNVIITYKILENNIIGGVGVFLIDKPNTSINFNLSGEGYGRDISYWFGSSVKYYFIDLSSSIIDIFNDSTYNDLYSCLTSNICLNVINQNKKFYFLSSSSVINNNSSYVLSFPFISNNYDMTNIYYSSIPLILSNSCIGGGVVCNFKKWIVNDVTYNVGDNFPTYFDFFPYEVVPDLPDEPDVPVDDETNHRSLFNKIYWLDDNNTEKGILSSIYILLFLYCLTMILFKIATLLKNKRW